MTVEITLGCYAVKVPSFGEIFCPLLQGKAVDGACISYVKEEK
jgi:hypothetical protein